MRVAGYRSMWVMVLFDLPTDSRKARKQYTRFRNQLLDDGFTKMQYSVYIRHCASQENAKVHFQRVRKSVPPDGEVRVVQFTDKQFGRMEVYFGKRRVRTETGPAQLEMF